MPNPYSWTRHFDVLFVDNPVGTGYSYVDPPAKVSHFQILANFLISLTSLERRFLAQVNANDESESLKFKIQGPPFSGTTSPAPEFVNDTAYERGYVTNQDGVASDMMTFLHKFYESFPEKRQADLFLASESYGGNDIKDVTDMQGNTLRL